MNQKNLLKLVAILVLTALALASEFVLSDYATSADTYKKTSQALDEKKETVMELTAAATATSAAITVLPGDAATPIAEKLADFSTYFLIVISALYLEKYLLTITGFAATRILIPLVCILLAFYVITGDRYKKLLAYKLAAFAAALVLIIPGSVMVSNMIEDSYSESIQATLDEAKEATETINKTTEEEPEAIDEDGNIISNAWNVITDKVNDAKETVTNVISTATINVEKILNDFIEALAVMIVTSCLIPIFVIIYFVWLVKIMFGISIPNRFQYVKEN